MTFLEIRYFKDDIDIVNASIDLLQLHFFAVFTSY